MNELAAEIPGQRVLLRAWSPTIHDAAARLDLVQRNLEYLRPWMHWIPSEPTDIAGQLALLESWDRSRVAGREGFYALRLVDDPDVPVGSLGIHERRGPRAYEIGMWVDESLAGRGYMTEAVRLATDYLHRDRGAVLTELHHDPANPASGRIAKKCGYLRVGEEPEPIRAPGLTGTQVIWMLTAERYRQV